MNRHDAKDWPVAAARSRMDADVGRDLITIFPHMNFMVWGPREVGEKIGSHSAT